MINGDTKVRNSGFEPFLKMSSQQYLRNSIFLKYTRQTAEIWLGLRLYKNIVNYFYV